MAPIPIIALGLPSVEMACGTHPEAEADACPSQRVGVVESRLGRISKVGRLG